MTMAHVMASGDSLRSLDEFGMPIATTAEEWRAKYQEAADMLADARAELDDFVHSSKDLEEEMLRELDRHEKTKKDLKDKVFAAENDRDSWKSKFMALQTTHNTTVNKLHRELDLLRQDHQKVKVQLRELEMGNDDLATNERAVSASLADLEAKYALVLEEKILLEQELLAKATLEEESQRLKDDLRDANAEIHALRHQLEVMKTNRDAATPPVTDLSPNPSISTLPTSTTDEELLKTPPPMEFALSDPPHAAGISRPTSQPTSRPSSVASSLGQAALLSRAGFPSNTPTPTPSRQSAPSPSRLPGPKTTPRVSSTVSRPPLSTTYSANASKSKGVQMVSEMRARVRSLEQRLHSRVPRPRAAFAAPPSSDLTSTPESPGWVLIGDETPTKPHLPALQTQTSPAQDERDRFASPPPSSFRSFGASPTNDTPTSGLPAPSLRRPSSRLSTSSIPAPSSRPITPSSTPAEAPPPPPAATNKRLSYPGGKPLRRISLTAAPAGHQAMLHNTLSPSRSFNHSSPSSTLPAKKQHPGGTIGSRSVDERGLLKGVAGIVSSRTIGSPRIGRPTSLVVKRPTEKKLQGEMPTEDGRIR